MAQLYILEFGVRIVGRPTEWEKAKLTSVQCQEGNLRRDLEKPLDESAKVTLDPELQRAIENGFPNDDAFDATVGLFGMLAVLMNRRELGEPDDEKVRKLERWIFGQSCAL